MKAEFKEKLKEQHSKIIALSFRPTKIGKKRPQIWEKALQQSLKQLKEMCYEDKTYDTMNMKRVMVNQMLQQYIQLCLKNNNECEQRLSSFFESEKLKNKV